MQIQRTIQTINTSQLLVELPESFVHRQVEILVITLDYVIPESNTKRRAPPAQLKGRVKELGGPAFLVYRELDGRLLQK